MSSHCCRQGSCSSPIRSASRAADAGCGPRSDVVIADSERNSRRRSTGARRSSFEALATTTQPRAVERQHAAVAPDDVAKILFTSGPTAHAKGVINTHRMLCSNQQMILQTLPFLGDEPPVLVDWLPWHHTFGGNHNIGIVLYNGGSLYLDEGRPMPGAFAESVRNLQRCRANHLSQRPEGLRGAGAVLPTGPGAGGRSSLAGSKCCSTRRRACHRHVSRRDSDAWPSRPAASVSSSSPAWARPRRRRWPSVVRGQASWRRRSACRCRAST